MRATIILYFIVYIICGSLSAQAQAPGMQWEHCYGTTARDYSEYVRQTADSGYLLTGVADTDDDQVSYFHGMSDIWLVKLNDTGNILWQKTYGGSKNDFGKAIQTNDGGYFIGGSSASDDGDLTMLYGYADGWAVKLDDTGGITWQYSFGGDSVSTVNGFQETRDSGYILCGGIIPMAGDTTLTHGNYDYWVVKLNKSGAMEWQRMLGGSNSDYGETIVQNYDGGYVAGGFSSSSDGDVSFSHGGADYWLVEVNDTGGINWEKTYGGSDDDLLADVIQTPDSGYILCGYTSSRDGDVTTNYGGYDIWVVKTDKAGVLVWEKNYGGSGDDEASSISVSPGGGYIIGGTTNSNDGDVTGYHGGGASDIWIVQIDPSGNIEWEKTLGGTGEDDDPYIASTFDSGIIVAGTTESSDGDVTGYHGGYGDCWVVKLKDTATATTVKPLLQQGNDIVVYPTITSDLVHIDLPTGDENAQFKVINAVGQQVNTVVCGGRQNKVLQFPDVACGLYILQVICNYRICNYKIIYQK